MRESRPVPFEIEIAAPRDAVWQILTDLPGYRRWNPFAVAGEGALRPGAEVDVTLELGGGAARRRQRVVAWEDDALLSMEDAGAVAGLASLRRTYRLHAREGGKTLLSQEAAFRGPLAELAARRHGEALRRGVEAESRALARVAEEGLERAPKRPLWSNWAGTATCRPARAFHPASREELVAIVNEARRRGRRVRAVGSGHSWSPLVPTDDFLVFVDRLDRVRMDLSVRGRPRVVAEAGATVRQINDVLEAAGYALPSNVVLESVRIGGLVQTGSHGSGWDARTLSDLVCSLDLVTATGEVRTYCEDRTPPEVMSAARLALGTFGLLHQVTLDVVPTRTVRQVNARLPMAEILRDIERLVLEHEALDVLWWPFNESAWIRSVSRADGTGRSPVPAAGVTARRRHDPADLRRARFDVAVSRAVYAWLARHPERTPTVCRSLFRLIPETSDVVDLVEAVHFRRAIEDFPVNSMELAVPLDHGFESFRRAWDVAVRHVEAFGARGIYPVNVNVDARFIRGSGALLSPAYGNERTAYVGLVTARGTAGWEELSGAVLRDWLAIPGARPHWAKELPTSGDLLGSVRRAFGPQLDAFLRIRHAEGVDPDDMFVSPFVAQLFAGDAAPRAHAGDPPRIAAHPPA